ncbi:MAG: hypothetical protein JRN57_04330, partial [Nitrososphaerota archaeon]|nr:hypothetical protein [Nitrososphaerota archaeon]
MERWVEEWLKRQRAKGEKCIEIKPRDSGYYVYRSTTVWDREGRRRKKHSSYLGSLDRERGLVRSSRPVKSLIMPRNVFRYGDALLLNRALDALAPLLRSAFPGIWEEIYAMALVRVMGYVPLKRVKSRWEKLYNPLGTTPQLDAKHLSEVLKYAGTDREAQDRVFRTLM